MPIDLPVCEQYFTLMVEEVDGCDCYKKRLQSLDLAAKNAGCQKSHTYVVIEPA